MRNVFFSFDWDDVWRANQVRNSWVTKDYKSAGFVDKAEIETLKLQTNEAIKNWIDKQMKGTSVTCVLLGENTSSSKWVKYEIKQSRKNKKGIVVIYIHNVKNNDGSLGKSGDNPLSIYKKTLAQKTGKVLTSGGVSLFLLRLLPVTAQFAWLLSGLVVIAQLLNDEDCYKVYDWNDDDGRENLSDWIEEAARELNR